MTEDSDNLEILEALAKIEDVGGFKLGDFMREHGMNPGQTAVFYRRLIKEARENKDYIKFLDDIINSNNKEITKLNADALAKQEEIKKLRARVDSLQSETSKKMDRLEGERHQLESSASQLKQKAEDYELVKQFLSGQIDADTIGGLYRLFADMNEQLLYAKIEGQPQPDSSNLDAFRRRLRDNLMAVLEIPHDTLEVENARLKEQIDAIVAMLKRVYGGGG